MQVLHARCAGLDISKKDAKVCVRFAAAGRGKAAETVTTWSSMTSQILALGDHLAVQKVTCVVATARRPRSCSCLVRAAGTDPAATGLEAQSFSDPRERSREVQRLEKLLEDAGIKLSSVATDIVGVEGRAMIEALIAGDRDADRMADLAQKRLLNKLAQLAEALVGRFNDHHAFLARVHLDLIDQHTAAIAQLTERIDAMMEPYRGFHDLICTIPGISTRTADVVVAEAGADMSSFPTANHLASGRCPPKRTEEPNSRTDQTRTKTGTSTWPQTGTRNWPLTNDSVRRTAV